MMDREYDIGQLVLFHERISDTNTLPVIGWITDKRFVEEEGMKYSIEWADGFYDNWYNQVEVGKYVTSIKRYARSLHK